MDGGRVIVAPDVLMKLGLTTHPVDEVCCWYVESGSPQSRYQTIMLAIVRSGALYNILRAAQDLMGQWMQIHSPGQSGFTSVHAAVEALSGVEAEKMTGSLKSSSEYKCARCELVFSKADDRHQISVHLATRMSVTEKVCDECLAFLYDAINPIIRSRSSKSAPEKRGRNIIL
jgi:hypothetical protein